MTVTEIALTGLDGGPMSLADYNDRAVLVVNVRLEMWSDARNTLRWSSLPRDYGPARP